jgi:hypothetical protein
MLIQIDFATPGLISQSAVMKDSIQVEFILPEIFVDSIDFQTLEPDQVVLESEVGPQMTYEEKEAMISVEETIDKATQVIAATNIVINVLLAASLRLLWNMVNLLQFLVYM